jgi:beta-1,2-mannosidase
MEHWVCGRMVLRPLIAPRSGRFDGALVEPGSQAILTEDGILLIYNGCNAGDSSLPPGAYTAGQALFDPIDPTAVIGRSKHPFPWLNQPSRFMLTRNSLK